MSEGSILVNKDAEWLDELGQTFIQDGDFATGMQLRKIALQLQQLDDRLLTLTRNGEYAAGRQSVYQELYAHSNLPAEYHHKVKGVKYSEDKVKRMPTGMTSAQLQAKELEKSLRKAKSESKFAGLSGLTLNLDMLKK